MLRTWIARIAAGILLGCTLAPAIPSAALAQAETSVTALNEQALQLHRQGKYAEAITLAEQALALAERRTATSTPIRFPA